MEEFKQNIPYYQVAKQALMNWNGLSEEEAEQFISTQSFDDVESQVYAKGSMDYAIEGIKTSLGFSDKEAEELSTFVYNGGKSKIIDWLRENKHLMSRYRQIRGLDSSQRERYSIKYHMLNMCENKLNSLLEEFECDM